MWLRFVAFPLAVLAGLLVAGVLTAGTGYYGYRKGWFKRLGIGK